MSKKLVSLKLDGVEVRVPAGMYLVDAAKLAGIDIPVFCYHPKMDPVGMCRMCLVEIGQAARDRDTDEPIVDEVGNPVIQFRPKLETACTTPVSDGMVVLVGSEKALEGRKQIVEHLLTSHPLDCPVCDKGGECPLQNLTMEHGPGESRFLFDDKLHLDKHVSLGELIFLDRERCIQCARCIRFQEEIAEDPVLGFSERGRNLEIVTFSDPGFDSYFSGNTTDICPVGALTTADFRFGARPWELNAAASICPHCPVGCNLTLNTRREAASNGRKIIKRVMPRQNEAVNEIWICDKGRFGHHFAGSEERLSRPLIRKAGKLVPTSWEKALNHAAVGLQEGKVVGLAGGQVSNEDLFHFRQLLEGLGGQAVLADTMAGGDLVRQFGVGKGTNIGSMGDGDAILVIASDLHEEAPIWWLRVIQAAKRGAKLIVANARETRLDRFTTHLIRFQYGQATLAAYAMVKLIEGKSRIPQVGDRANLAAGSEALAEAKNAIVFFGGEGVDLSGSRALAKSCARLLQVTDHVGRANNGLIGVWSQNNTQGAWDMGVHPVEGGLKSVLRRAKSLYMMAVDPFGDHPEMGEKLKDDLFVVVQDLYLTQTALKADVVLPAQAFTEREGTYTSGERRVQRYYPAVNAFGETRPDWKILALLGKKLDLDLETASASAVFLRMAESIPDYGGLTYQALAQTETQWPPVGDSDLYFGGTTIKNHQGIGVQLQPTATSSAIADLKPTRPAALGVRKGLLLVPVTQLYDHGSSISRSEVLHSRLSTPHLFLNPDDASKIGVGEDGEVEFRVNGRIERLPAKLGVEVPQGTALLGRSQGVPISEPVEVKVKAVKG